MFKFSRRLLVIFLALGALSSHASDKLLQSLRPQGLVNDYAHTMSATERQRTTMILTELRQKTGAEVSVVTLPTLDGGQVDDFANHLFERWGIGQKGRDNGILLLGATQERRGNRLRIEVGYGLEGIINDAAAGRILDAYVVPAWNQRKYGEAMANGAAAIAAQIAGDHGIQLSGMPQQMTRQHQSTRRKSNPFGTFLFIIFFIYMAIRHPRILLFILLTSGRGGGGGGGFGGGGGGGFGGGMSGGGGASR